MPERARVDLIVTAEWIIPIRPLGALKDHAIAVAEGRIRAIGPASRIRQDFEATETLALPGHCLLPGLVNAHTHAAMTLFRGLAGDLPLMIWLQEHIWPAEGRLVSDAFVRAGAGLAIAEMVRSGTTCFNDMYFFPRATAETAAAMGMRAMIGHVVVDFPTPYAADPSGYLAKAREEIGAMRDQPLIHHSLAPHAPYTVGDETLGRALALADELDLRLHMHLHETAHEVQESVRQYGIRPLERLERFGALSPRLLAVHMTELSEDEIGLCAARGVPVVHCPESNLKLASGMAPIARMLAAGIPLSLGTDGAASNDDLDMFGEMRTAALLGKGRAGDPTVMPAATALEMATFGGARGLGLGDEIGSLEYGKAADFIAVDLRHPATQPVYDPISQLVYCAGRDQVRHVWVNGRQLLRDGAFTAWDMDEILATAAVWAGRVADRGATA